MPRGESQLTTFTDLSSYAPNQSTQVPNGPVSQPNQEQEGNPFQSSVSNKVYYTGGKHGYSDTMAALTREQYQDWLNRFAPTEERLLELATTGELYDKQKERNEELAANNLARADREAANVGAKYGLGDRRTDQQKNNLELNNALSLASMNNEGRQAIGNLQRNLITGTSNNTNQTLNKLGQVK